MSFSRKKFSLILPICVSALLGAGLTVNAAQAQNTSAGSTSAGTTASTPAAPPSEVKPVPAHRKAHKKLAHKKLRRAKSTAYSSKLKGEEYKTPAAAKAHCPSQTVVWANTHGRVFHLPKSKYYGKTHYGAYVCEKAAETAGFKASKY